MPPYKPRLSRVHDCRCNHDLDALMGTFVVARLLHTAAYLSKQRHEIRAALFAIGSLVVICMASHVLIVAIALL